MIKAEEVEMKKRLTEIKLLRLDYWLYIVSEKSRILTLHLPTRC